MTKQPKTIKIAIVFYTILVLAWLLQILVFVAKHRRPPPADATSVMAAAETTIPTATA